MKEARHKTIWTFHLCKVQNQSPVVKTPAPNAGGSGSTPGWGTKILHALRLSQKRKEKKRKQQAKQSVVFEVMTVTPYDPWVRKIPWRRE